MAYVLTSLGSTNRLECYVFARYYIQSLIECNQSLMKRPYVTITFSYLQTCSLWLFTWPKLAIFVLTHVIVVLLWLTVKIWPFVWAWLSQGLLQDVHEQPKSRDPAYVSSSKGKGTSYAVRIAATLLVQLTCQDQAHMPCYHLPCPSSSLCKDFAPRNSPRLRN